MCTCADCLTDVARCARNEVRRRCLVSLPDRLSSAHPGAYARDARRARAEAIERIKANLSRDSLRRSPTPPFRRLPRQAVI